MLIRRSRNLRVFVECVFWGVFTGDVDITSRSFFRVVTIAGAPPLFRFVGKIRGAPGVVAGVVCREFFFADNFIVPFPL
jgi:hypothetical protein